MKKNTIMALKKIIQETVEKEVAKQMRMVINEITKPSTQVESPEAKPPLNVKDPVLNKILSETQGGIPQDTDAYPTMGGGAYTSDRIAEIGGGVQMETSDPNVPDFMKKAMSGHYGKVIKAVEKKHGAKT